MIRTRRELEHVLYLLNDESAASKKWERRIRQSIQFAKTGLMTEKEWKPRYIGFGGKEFTMERNSAEFEDLIGQRILCFNPHSVDGCIV